METIKEKLKKADSTKIFFTDLNGRLMSLPVNYHDIDKIFQRGIGFDGSSIEGYATVEHSDRLLIPDKESFQMVEFEDYRLGFFASDIYNEKKERAEIDPRYILKKAIDRAQDEFNCKFKFGPEHEFFLLEGDEFELLSNSNFTDTVHTDKAQYFQASPHDKGGAVRNEIIEVLEKCNIKFEKAHHEVAPSQHEINLEPLPPLQAADRTLLFTYIAQKIAAENNFYATFMPKPFNYQNRNAFHIHLSAQDMDGKNIFYDDEDKKNLSKFARHFIAGIIRYSRETSILMASTINSYKGYIVKKEAPIVRGWGFRNRSSMIRIPYSDVPKNTRIELRNPDPAGNVYLQMAMAIEMGLRGVRDQLECPKEDVGSTYSKKYSTKLWNQQFLPRSMYEALVEAERSEFLKQVLGVDTYYNLMQMKTKEWEQHRTHITPRERKEYLNF